MKLTIDQIPCDLDPSQRIALDYDAQDLADVRSGNKGHALRLRLPATRTNDRIFGFAAEPYTGQRFNAAQHTAVLSDGEAKLLQGSVRLLSAAYDSDPEGYLIEIRSGTSEWARQAAAEMFNTLGISFSGRLTPTMIRQTWTNNTPVKFFPVCRDEYTPELSSVELIPVERFLSVDDYHPFISAATVVQTLFSEAGYTLESDFLNGEFFRAFGYPPQNRYTRTDSIRSNNPFNHQKSNYLMSALENAKTYTGKNLETIFFRPMLSGPSAIDLGVRVLYNMPVPTTVQMWEPKTDILQKFTAAGWSGGAGSKKLQKTIPLNRVKAELGYSAADYFSLVYELITNRPEVNMEDLTGTELEEAETTLFKQAIAESIRSTMWVGDTSAESGANTFDGFLKTIATYSNNNKVYTYNYETDAMNTPANSVAMFDDLWKNADERLKDLKAEGQLAFFVSSDVYSAYEKHLDSMSTDGAYTDYINGRQNLLYHGIPVVDLRISSYLAKLSSSSPVPKSFCILTDRRNLVLAVNTADFPGNEIRMWYNPDEMENRQRAVFMAGCDVLDEGLVAFASRI